MYCFILLFVQCFSIVFYTLFYAFSNILFYTLFKYIILIYCFIYYYTTCTFKKAHVGEATTLLSQCSIVRKYLYAHIVCNISYNYFLCQVYCCEYLMKSPYLLYLKIGASTSSLLDERHAR